jgi:hypothetical protein
LMFSKAGRKRDMALFICDAAKSVIALFSGP